MGLHVGTVDRNGATDPRLCCKRFVDLLPDTTPGPAVDLPRTLPAFTERFGTDAQCRAYLVRALWPDGFRCGHAEAWSHNKRLIEECRSCGKQHSILAGTMFEQTKTGLAKWFLAIRALVLRGPDVEKDGMSSWTAKDLCGIVEQRYKVSYSENGMLKLLKNLDLSWQKTRPVHPKADRRAQAGFKKNSAI
jgi:hypothetical protein